MKKVMLDIGHGGSDPGATANNLVEKELNLKVGLQVREFLKYYDIEIGMTREKDISLSTNERIQMVKSFNPDLCVSIHHNAAANTEARGAEVIHAHYDEYDDKLALNILNKLAKVGMPTRRAFTKLNTRGSDWYYMIREIWNKNTDAIIVEGGFLTNAKDAELLKSNEFLKNEAIAIGEAIVEYLGVELNIQPHWGEPAIKELKDKGLIKDGHKGEDLVTWAEFATVINRLSNKVNI